MYLKTNFLRACLLVLLFQGLYIHSHAATYYWISSVAGNWSNPTNWSLSSGGTGGAGVPGTSDAAIFDGSGGRNGNCAVDTSPVSITSLTISGYTGSVSISGTLTTVSASVTSGGVLSGSLILAGGTATFSNSSLSSALSGSSTVFNLTNVNPTGTVSITTTGSSTSVISSATFSQNVSLTNSGSGTIQLSSNTYNGSSVIWTTTSTGSIANTGSEVYNCTFTINNNSTVTVLPANIGTINYNGNLTLNNTTTGAITFGGGGGTSTLAIGKTISFSDKGSYNLTKFTQQGTGTPITLVLATAILSLSSCTFNSDVDFTVPKFTCSGTNLFNGNFALKVTGSTTSSLSGTTFPAAKTMSVTNAGTSNLSLNSNTYNGTNSWTTTSTGSIFGTGGEVYNGQLTINNNSTAIVAPSRSGVTSFNANLVLINTAGGTIQFAANGGTSTLSTGQTITFSDNGSYGLRNFTQQGTGTPVTVNFTTASLSLFTCIFNSDVNFTLPVFNSSGTNQFNGNFTLKTTGVGSSLSGSTFPASKLVSITNSGTGSLGLSGNTYNSTSVNWIQTSTGAIQGNGGEIYNCPLTITNNSSASVNPGRGLATTFNGNLILTNTAGGTIQFSANGGTSTLSTGQTITFSDNGSYGLANFTQQGTATPVTVNFTTASLSLFTCIFNSDVNFTLPVFNSSGTNQFNGNFTLKTTGVGSSLSGSAFPASKLVSVTNSGTGTLSLSGNTYNSTSVSWIQTGTGAIQGDGGEVYNCPLTITNNSSASVNPGRGLATMFNGNLILINTAGGTIQFAANGGTSTLSTGQTITFSDNGSYGLRNFTQQGTGTPVTVNFTTASLSLFTCIFNSDVNFTLPVFNSSGTNQFNGNFTLKTTGVGSSLSGSTFPASKLVSITNSGTGSLGLSGNTYNSTSVNWLQTSTGAIQGNGGEVYNCPLTITNNSSASVNPGRGLATTYNGNLILTNTAGGTIQFSANGGTSTLSTGQTITFSDNGSYGLANFTQQGTSTPVTVNFTTASLSLSSCTFNSALSATAPTLNISTSTFNNTTSLTKTGTTTDNIQGNTYNAAAVFTMSGTGLLALSATSPDNYNSDLTINRTNGTIQPARGNNANLSGNLTVNSNSVVTFGSSGGSLVFNGTGTQTFSSTGSSLPLINNVTFNKVSGKVTLNSPFIVGTTATFTAGVVVSSSSNYFQVNNSATVNSANSLSFVDGPVVKIGSQAFTFPVGNLSIYRPISISAPSLAADAFTATFFHTANPSVNPSLYLSPLVTVSPCEYWTLNRTTGTSNVSVTLSWYTPDCVGPYISDVTTLQVARFNGTNWVSAGNGGTTGDPTSGTIVSGGTVSGFGAFALGSSSLSNPLPIEVTRFEAVQEGNTVNLIWETASELNNNYFILERSATGTEFKTIGTTRGAGTTNVAQRYSYIDKSPEDGKNYYRLSQVDYDGHANFAGITEITMENQFVVFPNPSSDRLYLGKKLNVEITDTCGKVFYQGINVDSLDVSQFPPGIYLVISGTVAKRVVIGQ